MHGESDIAGEPGMIKNTHTQTISPRDQAELKDGPTNLCSSTSMKERSGGRAAITLL